MDDKWLIDAIGEVQHRWTPAVGSGFAAMGMLLGWKYFESVFHNRECFIPETFSSRLRAVMLWNLLLLVATVSGLLSSWIVAFPSVYFSSNMLSPISSSALVAGIASFPYNKVNFSFLSLIQLLESWILCIALDLLGFPMQMPKELVIRVSNCVF